MWIQNIFSTVLNMSLTASIVILVICVARLAMKKAPKIYSYLLWALVLFRLLCPVSLLTSFSVIPARISSGEVVSDWEEGYIEQVQVHYDDDITYEAAVNAGREPVSVEKGNDYVVTGNDGISEPKTVKNTVMPLLAVIWAVGIPAVLLPGAISYIRIKRMTKVVIPLQRNIYIGDDVESPFVMGIFRPVIYLPGTLDEAERAYIIAHESHHIRRGDHIFKALGFLALAVHWFNPLVWLAFALAVRDMEMSCDEAVIRKLGENVRAEYSASLLKLATGHRLFAGGPLAFGENDPKGRVRNLSKWKKPAIWVIILCVAACAVLAIVLLTDLKTDPAADRENEIQETTENTAGVSSEEFFTMEDFSSLVENESTYADLCSLMPVFQQPEIVHFSNGVYCQYPAEDGGIIRLFFFGEDLVLGEIRFYPAEKSEGYPVKDISAFSFIVPGETTLQEVIDAVPHPTYGVPATNSGLSWLNYAVADGSTVRVHFYLDPDQLYIIHSVEIINNEVVQQSEGYPLVFADFNEERVKVSVFAYVSEGKLLTTDMFSYSGRSLGDYLEEPADVTSDILPEGTELLFVNKNWGSFRTNVKGLHCEGEMMYGDVFVYGDIDRYPSENGYYLGAPSGTNIYPKSIARQVDGFSMHLNPDDWIDQVAWTFTESEEGNDLFDYEIKVKVGDREQVIVNEDGFPCGKEDLSVWPIDLEQDGVYELVIYNKSYSRFGYLRIYRLNGTTYEEQFSYIFENMP